MRAALDARIAYFDRAGIGRYVWELQRAMASQAAESSPEVTLLVDARDSRANRTALTTRRVGLPARHRAEPLVLPWALRGIHVVHFPDHGIPAGVRTPSVVTVHDLSFLSLPDTHSAQSRAFYASALATLPAAARIIAVSEFVRDQLLARTSVSADRVAVIPEAAAWPAAQAPAGAPLGPPARPFALMIGTVQPRKNLERAGRAFVRSQAARELDLIIAGSLGFQGPEIVRAVRSQDPAGRIRFIGRVSDASLRRYLAAARCLLLPSLEEGFGLPLLEAMAAGVPCLAATAGALPEVAGGAAMLVDPLDVDSIRTGIERVVLDDALRDQLMQAGRARAAEFSWTRAAGATLDIYAEAA